MFRFEASGLPNVYLMGGYRRIRTVDGVDTKTVAINKLLVAIARAVVDAEAPLTPQEFRFLRTHIGYTQSEFGELIGATSQSIARWEKGKAAIPGAADRLLRLLCSRRDEYDLDPFGISRRILRNNSSSRYVFKFSKGNWERIEKSGIVERQEKMHGDTHRRRLVVSGVMTPEIVLDINSDSSRNDYPIEVSIADVSAGKVHSWLVRPSANRLCDSQDAEDRKLRGLSKNAFENGETASKVTREILRVLEGRRVVSNDIARDSVARLFAAAHMPSPVFYSAKADDIFATMARIVGRPKNSFEEVLRFRTAVCDRSAAGNAAGCAAVIELVLGNEEIDRDRIERVFGIWGDRARKPSPWRMKLSRLV